MGNGVSVPLGDPPETGVGHVPGQTNEAEGSWHVYKPTILLAWLSEHSGALSQCDLVAGDPSETLEMLGTCGNGLLAHPPSPPPSIWTHGASVSSSAKLAFPFLPGPFQDDVCDPMIDRSGR